MKSLAQTVSVILLLIALAGCTRMRFVIDAVPAVDELTETTVLEAERGGTGSSFFFNRADKVALIDVTGLIADVAPPGLLTRGENPLARFVEELRRAQDDDRVKAIVVRINSPGGTVTASDIAFRELERFKEKSNKPAIILMSDLAASGGYYLACAGDEIIAHPTTVTGSIGVIIQTINFSEGMQRIGIRAESITSGPNKAVGSPFEPMKEEHRAILQNMVNDFYARFLAVVKESRPDLNDDDVAQITDGRVVTGERALAVGLVDSLGDLHDAFDAAKRRAGITSARLVKYHRPLQHVGSAYATAHLPSSGFDSHGPTSGGGTQVNLMQLNLDANALGSRFGFYFLWDPGAW